ncbi:MAG: DNA polymerase Y family protein [Salinisphaeraceae bacterium]
MLWLCLWLPALALDARCRHGTPDTPVAITDFDRRRHLLAANPAARRAGVQAGQPAATARAVLPDLHLLTRDTAAEGRCLRQLAGWAQQFTDRVVLQPPQSLLLEVAGSLTLFGGAETLRHRAARELSDLGFAVTAAIAPTPAAATALARIGRGECLTRRADLAESLADLPLSALTIEAQALDDLQASGLHRLGDILALPAAALARRFGPDFITYRDRLLGRRPDPRQPYQPPRRYEGELELPAPADTAAALGFAARRLLRELCGQLRAMDAGVTRCELMLTHRDADPTRVTLGLRAPGRDPDHLGRLLDDRLDRTPLPAPVDGLRLRATGFVPLEQPQQSLLPTTDDSQWQRLHETLAARLGPGAIRGLAVVADHRPERASRAVDPGTPSQASDNRPRPLWLLHAPETLPAGLVPDRTSAGLTLLAGPERIESGWWDSRDMRRDYYVAATADGARWWIFRDRDGWFLHGLFA